MTLYDVCSNKGSEQGAVGLLQAGGMVGQAIASRREGFWGDRKMWEDGWDPVPHSGQ